MKAKSILRLAIIGAWLLLVVSVIVYFIEVRWLPPEFQVYQAALEDAPLTQYAVHADLKTGEIEWDYSTEKVEEDRERRCGKRMNGGWRCFCGQHEGAEAVA